MPVRAAVRGGVVLGLLLGCGDANGSGVSPDKPLAEATTDDLNAVCNAHVTQAKALLRGECIEAGLTNGSVAGCEQALSACDSKLQKLEVSCRIPDPARLTSCKKSTTFGDYESCLDQAARYGQSVSCTGRGASQAVPTCLAALSAACPGLASSDAQASANPAAKKCSMPGAQSTPGSSDDPCPQDAPTGPASMGYVAVSTCQADGTWSLMCQCVTASSLP